MKTFSELISWELEQEASRKSPASSLPKDAEAGKLDATVLRKLRYMRSGVTGTKTGSESWSAA